MEVGVAKSCLHYKFYIYLWMVLETALDLILAKKKKGLADKSKMCQSEIHLNIHQDAQTKVAFSSNIVAYNQGSRSHIQLH